MLIKLDCQFFCELIFPLLISIVLEKDDVVIEDLFLLNQANEETHASTKSIVVLVESASFLVDHVEKEPKF